MLKQFFPLLFFLSFLLFPKVSPGETFSLDLAAGALKVVPRTEEVALPVDVQEGEKGLKFDWDSSKSGYIEMAFRKPIKLPSFDSALVKAKFRCAPGCPLQGINVRFRDKDGEILQYRQNVSFARGGLFEAEWRIAPGGAEGSWGAKILNKKIDMPAQLVSMTFGYPAEISSGTIYLLDLSVETFAAEKSVQARRPLYSFSDSDLFRKVWGKGEFVQEEGLLKFDQVTSLLGLVERKFEVNRYERPPVRLIFDAELLEGEASLAANFIYADRAVREKDTAEFARESEPLKPGRHQTVIDVAASMSEAKWPVRLHRLDVKPLSKNPVSLRIHRIEVVEMESPASSIDFDLLTGTDVHVLPVGAEDQLKFRFVNRAEQAGEFLIQMQYENYFGDKETEDFELSFQPGEIRDVSPRWRPRTVGHWTISAQIVAKSDPGGRVLKSRSLAWIKPAGPTRERTPGFLFSVCTHTERWSARDRRREIEAAALCGVKVVRLGCGWGSVEPKEGDWNWPMIDELVKNYAEQGIEPQIILGTTPSWAVPESIRKDKTKTTWRNYPEDLQTWRNYVRNVAKRFKGKIRFYEIWNEPDLTGFSEMTLDQYVSLQKSAFEEIKKEDPEANVLTGGFATLSRHPGLIYQDFQRDYLLAAKGYFDIHAIHEHGWFSGYQKRIDELFLPLRAETGTDVPWYSNETAMTSVGNLEKRQAAVLFKKLLFAWIRGSIGYTWYDLRDDGFDPAYGEHHFGMVTNDFYPKEVYSVYNMLATYFMKMKRLEDYSPDSNAFIFSFGDGKDILLPAWLESKLGETRLFIVKTDAKSARLIDLMGNETPLKINDSVVIYEVGPVPRTLKLENATRGKPEGELLSVPQKTEVIPGRASAISVTLLNPTGKDAEFSLQLHPLPSGIEADSLDRTVTVPAFGTARAEYVLKTAKDFRQFKILPLSYRMSEPDISGIVYIPLKPALVIGSGGADEKPAFVLNRREQLTSTTPADPSNAHRLWSGPEDLSADVRLSEKDGVLHIKIKVEDDKSVPAETIDAGRGDQVRILFAKKEGDGFSEIALTETASGKTAAAFVEFETPLAQDRLTQTAALSVAHEGTAAIYDFSAPFSAVGFSEADWKEKGIRIDFNIGDDDGEGIDSWLHLNVLSPEKKTIGDSPLLLFE